MLHEYGPGKPQPSPEAFFILQGSLFSIWYQFPIQKQLIFLFDLIKATNNPESLDLGIEEQLNQREDQYTIPHHTDAEYQNKFTDFSSWMKAIDGNVWMLVGCSAHDLSDCDFQSMFEADLTVAEVANNIIDESGLGFVNSI